MKTLHLHRHAPPAPIRRHRARPHAPTSATLPAPARTTLRIGLVLSLVAAVLATVIEAVVHLPAALILIPVVVVGFALSWHASGREDVERRRS
jgi:hypothetical protein